MVQLYNYTDKEIETLLKSIVILIDTREQQNEHILEYLDKQKIKHEKMKLNHGDYSFYIPKNIELGIVRDLYFKDIVSIERKGSLEELSGNFTVGRANIEEEFTRKNGKMYLMIENANYEDIVKHNYNTQYEPKSFIATLKTYEARYNINTSFVSKVGAGNYIYYTFRYYLREYLKRGFI
ncbi:ERCC4 domain-containing protein [Clostridium sp.]|uniref:ERCC4 domain-containing protein n=1 Tax=Clostridium sp. TaxID=1506 RepID=UPI0032163E6F